MSEFYISSNDFKEGKNQNQLLEDHVQKIVEAYDGYAEVDKYMRVVALSEIKENDFNLNISRYIDTTEPEPEVDILAVKQTIADLEQQEAEIDQKLSSFLKEMGI